MKIVCDCGTKVELKNGEDIESHNDGELQVSTSSRAGCTEVTIFCPSCKQEKIIFA